MSSVCLRLPVIVEVLVGGRGTCFHAQGMTSATVLGVPWSLSGFLFGFVGFSSLGGVPLSNFLKGVIYL